MQSLRPLVCLLLLCLFLAAPQSARASTPSELFQKGWQQFHRLREDNQRAKYRSNWMRVKRLFHKAYEKQPEGPFAPKSLYYLGRTYQELGKRSYLAKDYRKAIDYFQKQLENFPGHDWSDDAKLFIAKIRLNHLEQRDQAYLDLLSIMHNYPEGDKRQEAKSLLQELDQQYLSQRESAPEPSGKQSGPGPSEKNDLPKLTKLQDIRHWSNEDYTRVVLDLEGSTRYNDFLLQENPQKNKPRRLVIDLAKTWIPEGQKHTLQIDNGLLQQVRTGQFRKSISRVVLDIKELEDYKVFALPDPYRVVVDVYAPEPGGKEAEGGSPRDMPLQPGKDAVKDNLVQQLGLDIETVMLDPGHGGKDPGAYVDGVMEKDINLRMAKILGEIFREQGLKVLYTRKEDNFVPLEERTALANSKNADLFISLHCNSNQNRGVQGLEIYNLNLADSEDAAEVAARENSVSRKKISDLEVILTDLMLKSKIRESKNLGDDVLDNAASYGNKFYDLEANGLRQAPFYVLMGAKMPAILVEMGYLTNPTERKRLQKYAYLKRLAWGISQGVMDYKEEITQHARQQ